MDRTRKTPLPIRLYQGGRPAVVFDDFTKCPSLLEAYAISRMDHSPKDPRLHVYLLPEPRRRDIPQLDFVCPREMAWKPQDQEWIQPGSVLSRLWQRDQVLLRNQVSCSS